ncbi:hypothetical protein MIND_00511200 [Mycena indigotica]|uniref:Uncharacterized protein n=1 Tax=Mycena indigotica TaxID=2126181 RepID=A0A8H6SXD4_9AGAR|nr:uncharacterized protein MIND_00511200 [Mycena indigotica]KAF7307176.1 hypothetical protein MIND_00511200 [Mycena indigotica]
MASAQATGFGLSSTPELDYVLADIPFFCLGLTALAVFAFFIVMRRINPAAIYLYTSSLFAFGAAILDLSQILLRGTNNTNQGLALDTVTGIVNTREVGFALAFGARYLYLWVFVSQRPRYEPRPSSVIDPLFSETHLHSASWGRWGVPGLLLKYTLLGAVISIPILQIIWRVATGNSPIYIAESTIQIAVSILFLAKLLLNLFLTTIAPWWRPFVPYIIPILALLTNTGIGTGNVLFFKFSETTLGRFLQAVSTYALLTNLLVFTFYNVPLYKEPPVVNARKRSSFFVGVMPKSAELFANFQLMSPTKAEKSDSVVAIAPTESPERPFPAAYDRPVSRESRISRIGSWMLMPRRKAPRPPSGQQKLWNGDDAERGISTQVRSASPAGTDIDDVIVLSPRVQVLEDKKPRAPRVKIEDPPRVRPSEEKQRPPLSIKTADPGLIAVPATTLEVATPSSGTRPYTGVSFASYYGMATTSQLTMPTIVPGLDSRSTSTTDSPVYGLDGIIPKSSAAPQPAAPESPTLSVGTKAPSPRLTSSPLSMSDQARNSGNSLDEILRQQTELDKSIAALRLISSPTSPDSIFQPPPEPIESSERAKFTRSISVSSGKSNRSEFSLSIFPEPPPAAAALPESLIAGGGVRARRQSLVPISAAMSDLLTDGEGISTPGTPTPAHGRFNSAGTQYDVTSFIGDLTVPGTDRSQLSNVSEKPEMQSDVSDVETPIIATVVPPSLRPLYLSTSTSALTSLPSANIPSNATSPLTPPSSTSVAGGTYEYPILRPLLLGSSTPAVSSPLSAGARRPRGQSFTRRPSRKGERPLISGPRQLESDQQDKAFESPRRPPVLKD